ncbi:MFS transporter [Croceicoccus bisphenolivorans]|uniref:MFS transporter n=1 Tax=Croceicoccus bisphenolivorans TaxID=1783232 RepID=UPI000A42DDD9|nr:MFS transporter [Croceicoccus bisphenolivorans]
MIDGGADAMPAKVQAARLARRSDDGHPGVPTPRRWLAIAAISFGNALLVVDGAIANVALPTLSRELGVTASVATNVIVIYQLVLVMGLLPMSSLGTRIGLRRVYQAGQVLFCLSSAACFFVETMPQLLVLRAVQGLGAAMGLSVSVALLRAIYPSKTLGAGLGFNSVVITSSLAIAPTIGGFILAHYAWQWIFVMAAPLAVLSLIVGRALPTGGRRDGSGDIVGSVWIALTMAMLIGGVQLASHSIMAVGIGVVACGVISLVMLVRRERRRSDPVVPVDLIATPVIGLSMLAALAAFLGTGMIIVSLPFRLEQAMGFTPDQVGLLLMPIPLTLMIVNPVSGWLSDRVAATKLGVSGLIVSIIGLTLLGTMPADAGAFAVSWRLVIYAAGFGFFISPNSRLIVGNVPIDRTASIGGTMQTVRMFGQAGAASIVGVLLALGLGEGGFPALLSAGMLSLAAIFSLIRFKSYKRRIAAG